MTSKGLFCAFDDVWMVGGVRTSFVGEIRRRGLRYGVASARIGGGQGIALLLENPQAQGPEAPR